MLVAPKDPMIEGGQRGWPILSEDVAVEVDAAISLTLESRVGLALSMTTEAAY